MIKWHDNETGHLVLTPKTCLHRNGALKRHFHCFFMILYFLLYYLCSLTCDVDGGIYVRNYWNVLFYVIILKINSLVINTCVPQFMRLLVGKVAPKQVVSPNTVVFPWQLSWHQCPYFPVSKDCHNRLINRKKTKIIQSHHTPTSTYLPTIPVILVISSILSRLVWQ